MIDDTSRTMRTIMTVTVTASALVLALSACPPQGKKAPAEADAPCTRFGQTCQVSPGKLGTCVQKDGCTETGPACFVCQSQH